jgi:putative glutamine amidotransferase
MVNYAMMSNRQPIIGITTYGLNEQGDFSIPALYVDSVRRAGGIPLLIIPGESHLDTIVNHLNGIILSGGGDLAPSTYNGKGHDLNYNIDSSRDETELKLAKTVLVKKIPTLAICRGIQVINTILGGTLFEHIPDHFGEKILHRLPPRDPCSHLITINKNSDLFDIIRKEEIEVSSWHHQSIDKPGDGLSVVAKSSDGVIEAIEFKGKDWFIGIQWHPELSSAVDSNHQKLFNAFVQRSK